MFYKITTTVLVVLASMLSTAKADPVSRVATLVSLHPMAVNRVHCPTCSGYTRVYVQSEAWGATTCRPDAGDLAKEDSHLLSILMLAWATGKRVTIEVNDASRPTDTVCRITALFVAE